jgi:hypothetical protein
MISACGDWSLRVVRSILATVYLVLKDNLSENSVKN